MPDYEVKAIKLQCKSYQIAKREDDGERAGWIRLCNTESYRTKAFLPFFGEKTGLVILKGKNRELNTKRDSG